MRRSNHNNGFTLVGLLIVIVILGILIVGAIFGLGGMKGCSNDDNEITSSTGVRQLTVKVRTDAQGRTTEQANIAERLNRANQAGRIQHLYVISAMSGDVIIYSTVKGKVTSSSKRLTPTTVAAGVTKGEWGTHAYGIPVVLDGQTHYTGEVLQDDGTYGGSIPYIVWYDSRGIEHQHYVTGGQIIHTTDQPMAFPKILLNMELLTAASAPAPAAGS